MNATNRKIDPKADPANDPAMAALRPNNRLQSLMAEIRQDNPIGKPDRPHPPVADLRGATSLDTQREELQRAVAPETTERVLDAPASGPQTPNGGANTEAPEPMIARGLGSSPEEPKSDAAPQPAEITLPPQTAPEPATPQPSHHPVNDAGVHADTERTAPRLRGRPRVSEEKKRESSYTLSPHVADRVRDLAALEQIRLKRTISASAIVEALIEIAEQHIQDNKVLKR